MNRFSNVQQCKVFCWLLLTLVWLIQPKTNSAVPQKTSSEAAPFEAVILKAKELRKTGEYELSNVKLDSALQLLEGFEFPGRKAELLTERGLNSIYLSDYSKGLKDQFSALSINRTRGDSSSMAVNYNYIAAIHQVQGNLQKAEAYYTKSRKLIEQFGTKRQLATVINNIGSLNEDLSNYDHALSAFHESLQIWTELNDSSWIAVTQMNIGRCYRSLGKFDEALIVFKEALAVFESIESQLNVAYVSQSIGTLYLERRNLKQALRWLSRGYKLCYGRNLNRAQESASSLVSVYEQMGDFQNALKYQKISVALKDSIFGREMTKEITELEMGLEFEREQLKDSLQYVRESLIQDKKISNQRIGLVSIGIITVIMLMLALAIYQGKQKSDILLLNILPKKVADELKNTGQSKATKFDDVTVIFTDFKGFTELSEILTAEELVAEINHCFSAFDAIMTKHGIEKIKTIGDAYMAASGLPVPESSHAQKAVDAALEMVDFIENRKRFLEEEGRVGFQMRVGINSGSVIAGIVGTKKFQYDIWGDTVNIAARMESSGEPGKVNISESTHDLVKDKFHCVPRGKIEVKGKGEMEMYFVEQHKA